MALIRSLAAGITVLNGLAVVIGKPLTSEFCRLCSHVFLGSKCISFCCWLIVSQ